MKSLPTTLKLDLLSQIQSSMYLPVRNYFIKTDESLRFWAYVNGRIQVITILKADVPDFLKKFGKISYYSYVGEQIKMYTKMVISGAGFNGAPACYDRAVPFLWEDIDFTEAEALFISAVYEYERATNECGLHVGHRIGKVITMAKNKLMAA